MSKQRVLVVDDEPRNTRIISEVLEDWCEFKAVSSGEEALGVIAEYDPELVLLDIMMPGIDGYEVCRRIKADPAFALVKVILVSGRAMIEERLRGYDAGADDYMTKPFVPEELLAKAKVFLRLASTERQLAQLNRTLEQAVEERARRLLDAEARLVNAAKMAALGEMAGGIAHEINTPLGTIGLIAGQIDELIHEDPIERETIAGMVKVVANTVKRISAVIQGMKTFSRDGSQDRFNWVSLSQILDSTLNLCRERLKHENVELRLGSFPEEFKIHCQPVQVSQVLLNLIGNACDSLASQGEKWIEIAVSRREEQLVLTVTDSGGGIPEELRQKIFQPFFTTKDIGKGTGLGLSISAGIMSAHGGDLTVDSECKNTRFVLRFPEKPIEAQTVDAEKKAA